MGDKIDMSLDDIIKTGKKGGRGGGRGGKGAGATIGSRGRGNRGGGGRGVFRGGIQKRRSGGRGGGSNRPFVRSVCLYVYMTLSHQHFLRVNYSKCSVLLDCLSLYSCTFQPLVTGLS